MMNLLPDNFLMKVIEDGMEMKKHLRDQHRVPIWLHLIILFEDHEKIQNTNQI